MRRSVLLLTYILAGSEHHTFTCRIEAVTPCSPGITHICHLACRAGAHSSKPSACSPHIDTFATSPAGAWAGARAPRGHHHARHVDHLRAGGCQPRPRYAGAVCVCVFVRVSGGCVRLWVCGDRVNVHVRVRARGDCVHVHPFACAVHVRVCGAESMYILS